MWLIIYTAVHKKTGKANIYKIHHLQRYVVRKLRKCDDVL